MTKIKFRILGKIWIIKLLKTRKYKSKHGSDSIAITLGYKREIHLSPQGSDKETIIHELVHAYLTEMCTKSSDLDVDALEEIFAELMSKRGQELLSLADLLLQKVQKATTVGKGVIEINESRN